MSNEEYIRKCSRPSLVICSSAYNLWEILSNVTAVQDFSRTHFFDVFWKIIDIPPSGIYNQHM